MSYPTKSIKLNCLDSNKFTAFVGGLPSVRENFSHKYNAKSVRKCHHYCIDVVNLSSVKCFSFHLQTLKGHSVVLATSFLYDTKSSIFTFHSFDYYFELMSYA